MVGDRFRRAKKVAISAFIVLSASAALYCNTPWWLNRRVTAAVEANTQGALQSSLYAVPTWLYWWAHKAGINWRWEMYSSVWRRDFRMVAVGIDERGRQVLLPEPLQVPRTWFEHEVADFREAKYQINLFRWPSEWPRYCSYLMRRYKDNGGVPLVAIRLDLQYREYVADADEAGRTGSHLTGETRLVPMYVYPPAPAAAAPTTLPAGVPADVGRPVVPGDVPTSRPATRPGSANQPRPKEAP
jgi:hypothetical protein